MKLEPFPIDKMLKHARLCLDYRKWLVQVMEQKKMPFKVVSFEEIYIKSAQDRNQKTKGIFEFISAKYDENEKNVTTRLFSGGQKSDQRE